MEDIPNKIKAAAERKLEQLKNDIITFKKYIRPEEAERKERKDLEQFEYFGNFLGEEGLDQHEHIEIFKQWRPAERK
eukprot:13433667-Heterocapsa_arctica.AAC.1